MKTALIVMAKAPVPGFAKTRLVPPLSFEQAAELQRCLTSDVLERPWANGPRVLAVAGTSENFASCVEAGWRLTPQRGADLGERLSHASREATDGGADAVVFLGTDSPDLPDALRGAIVPALEAAEVVIGPAFDGGYYTIGSRGHLPWLFEGMPWSEATLFDATLEACARHGARVGLLPAWYDIDNIADLRRFGLHSRLVSSGLRPHEAPRTRALLEVLRSDPAVACELRW